MRGEHLGGGGPGGEEHLIDGVDGEAAHRGVGVGDGGLVYGGAPEVERRLVLVEK